MRAISMIAGLLLALSFASVARADGYSSTATILYFSMQQSSATSEGPFIVQFANFDAGCGDGGYVKLDKTYLSTQNLAYAKDILLAAQLSNRKVTIRTTGCIGTYGKISQLGLT